ncbi:MAG: restriction endonuclease subunit S [Treponema sp.]|nr:restriction endonuclease subunit S [Treponema sp.]
MKQTEIGLIPDDWEVKKLGDIYNFQYGDGNTNPSNNGAYPVYGANGIIGGYTKFNAVDSIVIGHMGEYAGSVIWASGKHFVTYNGTITKPKDEKNLNPKYGYYSLLFKNINKICAGSGYPFLAYDKLNLISIPLPPLAEQQRIAKALSDVDALISKTEKLIQKKKNIKQGAMQNLLTGKKRLPGFAKSTRTKMTELGEIPEDWEVKNLGEMLKIGHGKDYKNLKSGNVPVYGTGGYMTSVNDFLYEGETVCIGRKGTIDKPQYHSGKIWTVDTLFYTYDFKSLNPKYLFYKFCLIDWLSMNEASGVPSLTAKNIEDIQIAIPTVEEQTAIANVLSSMDKEIETLNTKLEKYRNLKTAMMQQLLTGKIRLM